MATLGSLLKGLGQTQLLPLLLSATWNGDVMAGTPAPLLGLEVTHTIEAMCWDGRAGIVKIWPFTSLKH